MTPLGLDVLDIVQRQVKPMVMRFSFTPVIALRIRRTPMPCSAKNGNTRSFCARKYLTTTLFFGAGSELLAQLTRYAGVLLSFTQANTYS